MENNECYALEQDHLWWFKETGSTKLDITLIHHNDLKFGKTMVRWTISFVIVATKLHTRGRFIYL